MRKPLLFLFVASALVAMLACGEGKFFPDQSGGGGGTGQTGTPKFAYVANFTGGTGTGSVSGYTVNASNGLLTQVSGSPFASGTGPNGIGADSAGQFVYVSNQGGGVFGYTVDRTSGALAAISGSPFTAGNTPAAVTVDPQARFVYVANNGSHDISGYTITPSSGVLTGFASTFPLGGTPLQLHIDPSGRFVYAALGSTGVEVFDVNSDGTLTSVRTVPPTPCAGANDIAIDPASKFAYIVDGGTGMCAYAINANSGDLTLINQAIIATGNTPIALAVSPTGKQLYAVNKGANSVSGFLVNTDGTLTSTGSTSPTGNSPVAIAIDPSGSFAYVANLQDSTLSFYTINTSGALSAGNTVATGQGPASVVVTK